MNEDNQVAKQAEPKLVQKARQEGWGGIAFKANEFERCDSCGCCGTIYHAGWYGNKPDSREYSIICSSSGVEMKSSVKRYWTRY